MGWSRHGSVRFAREYSGFFQALAMLERNAVLGITLYIKYDSSNRWLHLLLQLRKKLVTLVLCICVSMYLRKFDVCSKHFHFSRLQLNPITILG